MRLVELVIAGRGPICRGSGAFIIAEAVSLATRDLAHGIGPAIRSGLCATDAITRGSDYDLRTVPRYSIPGLLRETPLGCSLAHAVTRLKQ
jgi:hypothetical protein